MTLVCTIIAMFSTILGSSCIFFIKQNLNIKWEKFSFGIIYGIMISSIILSIFLPIMDLYNIKPTHLVLSFLIIILVTILFKVIDKFIYSKFNLHLRIKKNYLLIVSSSLRNIIEGTLIGVAFSLSYNSNWNITSALALSLSMILQNFLESISISLTFKDNKFTKLKSFLIICIPGVLEPLGGILGILMSRKFIFFLPLIILIILSILITILKEMIQECSTSIKLSKYVLLGFTIGSLIILFLETMLK